MNHYVEGADAIEQWQIAHGGRDLPHNVANLVLYATQLLGGCCLGGITDIAIAQLGLHIKVPALEHLLGVGVRNDHRDLVDHVLREPFYR